MVAIPATRAAARLRSELNIDPKMVDGRRGELTVLVDGREVIRAGRLAVLGIGPSVAEIVSAVRAALHASRT